VIGSGAAGIALQPFIKSTRLVRLMVTLEGGEELVFVVFEASCLFEVGQHHWY